MDKIIPPRLRWACRRGMLELDLLLTHFLEEVFLILSDHHRALFAQLLEMPDQDLFLWLTGKEVCKNQRLNIIVEKIRHHAAHRHSFKAF